MRNIQRAALGVSLVLLMSGCVVAPYPASDPYYVEPVVVVPPPRVEYPGPPPTVGYVWIGGNWNWYQGRHVWAPGRWDPPEWRHMEVAGGVENNEARVGSNATLIVAMVGVSIRRPGDDDMTWPEAVSSVHRPMGIAMMERSCQQTGRSSVMRTELRGFPKRATKVSTTVSGDPDLECNKYCQGSFCA